MELGGGELAGDGERGLDRGFVRNRSFLAAKFAVLPAVAGRAKRAEIVEDGVNPERAVKCVVNFETAGFVAMLAATLGDDDALRSKPQPVGGFQVFGVAGELHLRAKYHG